MTKIHPTEKEISSIEKLIDIAVTGSKYFADEFPKWLRPLGKIISFVFILLFMVLISLYFLIKRKRPNSYQNLKTDLISRWHSESSVKALHKLRKIYNLLLQHSENVMLGGYKIAPYGKFNFYDFANVSELLYHWEIQHHCITEALKICEEMLEPGKNAKDRSRIFADWIIKKARAIKLMKGDLAAQEYLLRNIDKNNEKCQVRKYLYELRGTTEV